jgi:hypothetical protein
VKINLLLRSISDISGSKNCMAKTVAPGYSEGIGEGHYEAENQANFTLN